VVILSESGPDAVLIETLAAQLGVTRGGFYRQFSGRQELLDSVLDTWEHRSIDEVGHRVEEEGGDTKSKVRKAGRLTFSKERRGPSPGAQGFVDGQSSQRVDDGDRSSSGTSQFRHRSRGLHGRAVT
jgi:AcrR family transcriptional regulator